MFCIYFVIGKVHHYWLLELNRNITLIISNFHNFTSCKCNIFSIHLNLQNLAYHKQAINACKRNLVGSGVERMGKIHFLARCHKRQLNQAAPVSSCHTVGFFWVCFVLFARVTLFCCAVLCFLCSVSWLWWLGCFGQLSMFASVILTVWLNVLYYILHWICNELVNWLLIS